MQQYRTPAMQARINECFNNMLQKLIDIGILKQSQVNGTLRGFIAQAFEEEMPNQKLAFYDKQGEKVVEESH